MREVEDDIYREFKGFLGYVLSVLLSLFHFSSFSCFLYFFYFGLGHFWVQVNELLLFFFNKWVVVPELLIKEKLLNYFYFKKFLSFIRLAYKKIRKIK